MWDFHFLVLQEKKKYNCEFCLCMCQWGRIQFNHSIPSAFCLSHYTAYCPRGITLSSLGHLSTQITFRNHLSSHHGCNCLQHCLCEDKRTTSQLRVPFPISLHLFGFWVSNLWATCWITNVSLMVVYGEFMHIPNSRDITSLAPTNLSICLSVMWLAPTEIIRSSYNSFWLVAQWNNKMVVIGLL